MDLLKLKDVVKEALMTLPKTRENDNFLVVKIWGRHFKNNNRKFSETNLIDFLTEFSNGDLPSFESITRCRRKLQELHPELRGPNYKQRQDESDKVVEQLNKFKA